MKLSARNILKGKVAAITTGPIAAKVTVDIGGGVLITATVTADAVADLGLAVGSPVSAVIKSSSVMLATD